MVMVKSTTACVLFVLLCAAWLSNARLHPAGAEVNDISATKELVEPASVVIGTINSTKVKNLVAVDGNLNKSAKQVARKCGNAKSSRCSAEIIMRSLTTRLSGEVDGGFVAFTADYHSPRHHPPKNNK